MNQLLIDFTARDVAIARPVDKATKNDPMFSDRAKTCILASLAKHGQSSGEFLINECKLAGIRPHDDRAFGGPVQSLLRKGLIKRVAYCMRSKGHGAQGGSVYELVQA